MTTLDQCDEAAANVARAYQALGLPAFTLAVREDGSVSVIGPMLAPDTIARMLRTAADAYVAQAGKPAIH